MEEVSKQINQDRSKVTFSPVNFELVVSGIKGADSSDSVFIYSLYGRSRGKRKTIHYQDSWHLGLNFTVSQRVAMVQLA